MHRGWVLSEATPGEWAGDSQLYPPTARTLNRAPVGKGPPGPDWLAISLGFGLDGRLLLERRGRVYL